MRNPRRDAIEYGVLVTLTTMMVGAYGVIIYLGMTPDENGKPRKLEKVDLNAPFDLRGALRELRFGKDVGSSSSSGSCGSNEK